MPLCNGRQRNGPMDVTYSDIRDGDERKPATRRQAHAWLPSWCWFTVSVRSLSSTDSRISTPLLYHSQNPRHPDGLRPFLGCQDRGLALGGRAGGFDFYIERLVCLVRCHLDACTKKRNVDGRMRACRTIDIDAQNTTGQEVVAPLAFGGGGAAPPPTPRRNANRGGGGGRPPGGGGGPPPPPRGKGGGGGGGETPPPERQ